MLYLWSRFSWRHAVTTPGQTLMLVAILSLGIAVYMSVRLANRAAVAGFEQFTMAVTGRSDFVLTPEAGRFNENWLRELRDALGAEPATIVPMVERSAPRPRREGEGVVGRETFRLVGIDLVAARNFLQSDEGAGTYLEGESRSKGEQPGSPGAFRDPGRVWVSQALARRDGIGNGDTIELVLDDSIASISVAGVIAASEGLPEPELTLMVMDLPDLQKLTGTTGWIDRAEVIVPEGPDLKDRRAYIRNALEDRSDGRWRVETPASRRATGETMTAAFRLNLTVLSLIALLVGVLLIVQALDGSVVRRRQEIAVLRSLGLEGPTIQLAWLLEAAAIGLVAGLTGTLLGWGGAQFTVRLVGRTVNALYYGNTVAAASLHLGELAMGVCLGVVASIMAGWIPARAAASIPPAQMLGRGHVASGMRVLQRKVPALALIGSGLVLSQCPPLALGAGVRFPLAGYAAALCGILGVGMLAGSLFKPVALAARSFGRRHATARVALGHLEHPAGRARLAVAGLVAAMGMSAGMIILVASFETTVRGWIGENLRADLFVASDGAQDASSTSRIREDTWRALLADRDTIGAYLFQGTDIRIDGIPTFLGGFGIAGNAPAREQMWISGPDVSLNEAPEVPGTGYASESFAERFQVAKGSIVRVPTPVGVQELRIAGVFADYGNDRGSVLVPMASYSAWLGSQALVNLAVFVRPGADPEAVRSRWLPEHSGLRVLTNSGLRTEILRIFRQTFSITYALELIGVAVAVAGLALTMASMLLDRREELTTMRALGFTHQEIAAAAAWEGALTAAAGAFAGTGLSLGLGYLLVFVINKQSFGWTLQLVIPAVPLFALAAVVVATGAIVSWYIGRWSAALPADKEE